MQLVKGRAADRPAAVVPEGDGGLVGRIVLAGEFQEVLERLGIAHVGGVLLVHQLQAVAGIDPALELRGVHLVVLPLSRAAGLDDHRDVFGQLDLQQLVQVGGGAAVVGLQITAAEVPVHGPAAVPGGGFAWDVCRLRLAAGSQGQAHPQGQEEG